MRRGNVGSSWTIVARRAAFAALLATVVFFAPAWAGAQSEGLGVGYVDLKAIQAQYLVPNLQAPMAALEQQLIELQAEFDQQSAGLDDEAKQALFNTYQQHLDAQSAEVERLQHDLEAKILEAIASVAAEQGVEAVLAKQVVLYGGTDLTGAVLRRLGVQTAPSGGD